MEERFEEKMTLNSVLKDRGKHHEKKEKDKSFKERDQEHSHGIKPHVYKDNIKFIMARILKRGCCQNRR